MKKLIEELSGVGEVFENENSLGNINYRINIFREIVGGEEGLKETNGRISANYVLISKLFEGNNLHLVLEDGRKINFFMKNTDGDVLFSGSFF
jgi:hypothetical protein